MSKEDMIERINREGGTSETAEKGSAYHKLIETLLVVKDKMHIMSEPDGDCYTIKLKDKEYEFKPDIIREIIHEDEGGYSEEYIEHEFDIDGNKVLLYGYVDRVEGFNKLRDYKTTGNYTFPKYINAYQHKVYLVVANAEGYKVDEMEYDITDFNDRYSEIYSYNETKMKADVFNMCRRVINFVEENKESITDKKIFGGENDK